MNQLNFSRLVAGFEDDEFEWTLDRIVRLRPRTLLLGPTGVGKTTLARYLHDQSVEREGLVEGLENRPGKFVHVDMASVPPGLAESELFGHKKGAFTDARADRVGKLDDALRGTLFLDELHYAPKQVQAKLLIAAESGTFQPLGSPPNTVHVLDAWIIAATTKPGDVLPELFHRLGRLTLPLNPLSERLEVLREIAVGILAEIASKTGEPRLRKLRGSALKWLRNREWPGNIRELESVLWVASILADPDKGILVEDLELAGRLRSGGPMAGDASLAMELALGLMELFPQLGKHTSTESGEDPIAKLAASETESGEDPIAKLAASDMDLCTIVRRLVEHPHTKEVPTEDRVVKVLADSYVRRFGSKAAASKALGRDEKTLNRRLKG